MVIVQTEVVEKQEAINHAVSFGTIGIWIKACHGASASDNAVMLMAMTQPVDPWR
jgi:hypothetical protein